MNCSLKLNPASDIGLIEEIIYVKILTTQARPGKEEKKKKQTVASHPEAAGWETPHNCERATGLDLSLLLIKIEWNTNNGTGDRQKGSAQSERTLRFPPGTAMW